MATYSEIRNRMIENAQMRQNAVREAGAHAAASTKQKEEENKGGFFGGLGYALEKLGLGVIRAVEGIGDYVVGGVADLFGADDFADELMKSDWLNYEHADEWYNPNGAMEFVGDVAGGVGGMLPAIGLSFIPGVGPMLSTGAFMTSAAGQNVSEAAKQNGEAGGKEWLYGTLSGVAEGGIEALSGGIGGTQAGKVLGKQLAKTTAGKIGTAFISEGLEEVAADIVDPALKRITGVDKNATVDWANLPKTFLVGGTTGAVMGGLNRGLSAVYNGGFNNANAAENAQEMSERLADNNVRQAKGKKLTYTQEDINVVRDRLSKNLQKMNEKKRAAFLSENKQIAPFFNTDGTVKGFAATNNNAQNSYNSASYSASLQGMESELAYKPIDANETVSEDYTNIVNNMQKLTGGNTNIVLTNDTITTADGQQANGAYKDGVIYLSAKASTAEKLSFVAGHEIMHTLEATKEYAKLANAIDKLIADDSTLAEKYNIQKYAEAYENVQSGNYSKETLGYQVETELIADFVGNELLKNPQTVQKLVQNNESLVRRILNWVKDKIALLRANKSDRAMLAEMQKAEGLLSKALAAGRGGVSLNEIEESVQARKQAEAESSHKKQTAERTTGKLAEARYSLSERAKQEVEQALNDKHYDNEVKLTDVSPSILLGQEGVRNLPMIMKASHIRENIFTEEEAKAKGLKVNKNINYHGLGEELFLKVIDDLDNVTEAYRGTKKADNPVRRENYFLLISKQKDKSGNVINVPVFINEKGIYNRVFIDTNKIATVFGRDGIYSYIREQISKGNLVRIKKRNTLVSESTTPIVAHYDENVSTSIIRENSEKSTENAKKVEKNFAGRASLDVDSEGRKLSKEQQEYFKDSKVRDKDGNLLVVYHQTENDFTEFDTQREGAGKRDNETPHGIFLKPTNANIGLKGDKQMQLYAKITNPLELYSREHAQRYWRENIEGYGELVDQISENDKKYGAEFDEAFLGKRMARREFMSMPKEQRDKLMEEYEAQAEKILDKWTTENTELDVKAKALIDEYMQESGYDGIHLVNDKGSMGRSVETYIALSPNQVKNITNKTPTSNPDIRYSLDLIDNYTEKQYNDFGWARVNDVLTARENADFRSKYAKIKSGQIRANRTKNGKIIVAVNDGKDTSFGVDNVLVYAKGPLENYKINKVVKINLYDETSIEIVRSEIYEREKSWTRASDFYADLYEEELVREYTVEAFQSYQEIKRAERERSGGREGGRIDEVNQREQNGRGAFGETSRYSLNTIKSYSQADMKATVQDMEDMFVAVSNVSDEYQVRVNGKARLAQEFSKELNGNAANTNKTVEERAKSFVDRVINNLVITKKREEVAEAEATIEALRPYYHSMDLSSVKSEILDPADLRLWSGGEKALSWDVILQEITEAYPQFLKEDVGNTDIDTLLNVFEVYKQARKVLNENRLPVDKAVGDLAEVKKLMARQLSFALEEYGTRYKKERKATYMTDEEYEESLVNSNSVIDDRQAEIRRVTEEPQKLSKKEHIDAVKAKAAEGWLASQIEFTNVQAGIEKAGENLGLDLKGKVQKARSARSAALNMITEAQMDYKAENVVGKSLTEIFEPIHNRGDEYTAEFYEYLLHWHNADRMALERKAQAEMRKLVKEDAELSKIVKRKNITEAERNTELWKTANGRRYLSLAEVRNKPVFGESVTEKGSISRRAELQTKHPEFVSMAKEVWGYNQNLLQRRVDSGLITQEMADELNKMYAHYVPTFRDMDGAPGTGRAGTKNSKYAVEVKKTIKTAKGSNLDILDISLMMANQTQAVLRAEAINELANALYEGAVAKNDFSDIEVKDIVDLTDPDVDYEAEKPKNNEVVFYKDGKRITMAVSQPVFVGFESFNGVVPFNDPVVKSLEKVNEIFKKAVTQWNPLFMVRNAVRDFQEAIFYTKNGIGKYIANLPKTIKIMAKKGKPWQQYLAMGGVSSGYFNNETGIYDRSGKVKKGIKKVSGILGAANEFIEQIPRFNEFVLSVQSGKSLEDALLDAADVTTNFSRGGKITKVMNRTLIPFLNPSVQGWSKLWRTATGRKTARQWTMLIVKALAFGLSVGLINDLVNGDDEEYKALNTSDKENYFIFPAGDKFIKIPKGRVVAALGSVASRTKALLEGDEHAFDDWLSSVSTMISPVESASRTIFAPFGDVQTNTTWYGGQIESQRLQSLAPSERYDESTSSIAIALGKFFDYSPKKIHYLIDQYSGVIGDIILPATTAKAERGMFSAAFTIDPVLSNGISTEFYDLVDETTYAKNAGDPTAVLKLRYLNEVSNAVSDMYQQKRDIANNTELSDKEKQEQTRVVQALINETLSSAISGSTDFEQILLDSGYETAATALVEDASYQSFTEKQQTSAARKLTDYYYAKAYSKISGGEYSYKYHLYEAAGVEKTAIYLTELAAIEGDKSATGQTVSGSRKKKVQAYIEKLRLSAMQKYILLYLAGYAPSDTGKAQINNYLRSKGFSKEDIEIFWG